MAPKQGQHREAEEFPLAHDAATWDEDNTDSSWDDEEAQLADEFKLIADD